MSMSLSDHTPSVLVDIEAFESVCIVTSGYALSYYTTTLRLLYLQEPQARSLTITKGTI